MKYNKELYKYICDKEDTKSSQIKNKQVIFLWDKDDISICLERVLKEIKKHIMEFESDEIEHFRDEIESGKYPPKCLKCYESGLRYCGFWLKKFNYKEVKSNYNNLLDETTENTYIHYSKEAEK